MGRSSKNRSNSVADSRQANWTLEETRSGVFTLYGLNTALSERPGTRTVLVSSIFAQT